MLQQHDFWIYYCSVLFLLKNFQCPMFSCAESCGIFWIRYHHAMYMYYILNMLKIASLVQKFQFHILEPYTTQVYFRVQVFVDELNRMKAWCDILNIKRTPALARERLLVITGDMTNIFHISWAVHPINCKHFIKSVTQK